MSSLLSHPDQSGQVAVFVLRRATRGLCHHFDRAAVDFRHKADIEATGPVPLAKYNRFPVATQRWHHRRVDFRQFFRQPQIAGPDHRRGGRGSQILADLGQVQFLTVQDQLATRIVGQDGQQLVIRFRPHGITGYRYSFFHQPFHQVLKIGISHQPGATHAVA